MSKKWRTVSIYKPLIDAIQNLIDEGVILHPNVSAFVNAIIEREYQELSKSKKDPSPKS